MAMIGKNIAFMIGGAGMCASIKSMVAQARWVELEEHENAKRGLTVDVPNQLYLPVHNLGNYPSDFRLESYIVKSKPNLQKHRETCEKNRRKRKSKKRR